MLTEYEARILKLQLPEQKVLKNRGERCSADPAKLAAIGRAVGHQIRITRKDDPRFFALYTIKQANPPTDLSDPTRADVVRTGEEGRNRLGTKDTMEATVHATVLDPMPSPAEPIGVRFFEESRENRRQHYFIVIAPHGGKIEEHTDEQAELVFEELSARAFPASLWLCRGYGDAAQGAFQRWHITSTDINPACFPALQPLVSQGFCYGLAFHGFERKDDQADVYIGGRSPGSLKVQLENALNALRLPLKIKITTKEDDAIFQGNHSDNIINRLATRAVHLEQSAEARAHHRQIAAAVATVFASRWRLLICHLTTLLRRTSHHHT